MAAGTSASAPPDLRREQMLRAAAELIGERGFSETRIADVARRAGASPALVIYYFATKDQLLTEALRFSEAAFYRTVTAELETLRTARERLELLVAPPASRRARGRSPAPGGCGSTCGPRRSGTPRSPRTGSSWTSGGATRSPGSCATARPGRDRRCRRRRVRDHLLGADRRAVDPGRAAGPGRRPGPRRSRSRWPSRPASWTSPGGRGGRRRPRPQVGPAAADDRGGGSGSTACRRRRPAGRRPRRRAAGPPRAGTWRAPGSPRRTATTSARRRWAPRPAGSARPPAGRRRGCSARGRRPGPPPRGRRCAPAVRPPAGRSRST